MRHDVGALPLLLWIVGLSGAIAYGWLVYGPKHNGIRHMRVTVPMSEEREPWAGDEYERARDAADEPDVPDPRPDYRNPLWSILNPDAFFRQQRDRFQKGESMNEARCPKCGGRLTVRARWPFCEPCGDLWFDDFKGFARRIRQRAFDPPDPRQTPEPPAEAA